MKVCLFGDFSRVRRDSLKKAIFTLGWELVNEDADVVLMTFRAPNRKRVRMAMELGRRVVVIKSHQTLAEQFVEAGAEIIDIGRKTTVATATEFLESL